MNYSTPEKSRDKAGANNAAANDAVAVMQAGATLLSATTITGDDVYNLQDQKLGKLQDIILDIPAGKIRYAVLSSGGFMSMGDRLYAVPWKALQLDKENQRFKLDINIERLQNAPGFDKHHWPNMADATWNANVESYYAL